MGRRKREFGDVLGGHTYGVDGRPVAPDKKLATHEEKLFVGTRTREIAVEMLKARGLMQDDDLLTEEADALDLEELWHEAQDRAAAELTQRKRSKRPLFIKADAKPPGRPRASDTSPGPSDETLARDFSLAASKFRTARVSIKAVSDQLWRVKYKGQFKSSPAFYKRLQRALKKLGHKLPAK